MLKTKEEKVRIISMPAFVSSIFGVTEPAIYGVKNTILHFMWCFRTYGGCHDGPRY